MRFAMLLTGQRVLCLKIMMGPWKELESAFSKSFRVVISFHSIAEVLLCAKNTTHTMDTRIIKIALTAASLGYAVFLFTKGHIGSGIGMVLVAALGVLATLQSLRLIMAFAYLRQQKMDDARKWMGRINPNHLWKRRRAYFFFLQGSLTMEQNMNDAAKYLKMALDLGLKQSYDQAAAKLNLAVVASAQRRPQQAKALLNECKRLDEKGVLKKDIKMVENALKNPHEVHQSSRR